ncbi:MAG: sigma-70 family RNA polymerase sigma factor, partial [Victivallales bacterium]|nr:sigma-70 family RNA polymerase sigma factor [Victivallales bacterium]
MAYTTRKDLFRKVHERDDAAWRKFDEMYTPMILLRAKDLRLMPSEVDELKQNVRLAVFKNDACGRHNPELGRFRDYLRRIITNCAYDILNARKSSIQVASVPEKEDESSDQAFEDEWRQYILEKAMEEVRAHCDETTFMAFDLYGR